MRSHTLDTGQSHINFNLSMLMYPSYTHLTTNAFTHNFFKTLVQTIYCIHTLIFLINPFLFLHFQPLYQWTGIIFVKVVLFWKKEISKSSKFRILATLSMVDASIQSKCFSTSQRAAVICVVYKIKVFQIKIYFFLWLKLFRMKFLPESLL